jgi:hypothetical protein
MLAHLIPELRRRGLHVVLGTVGDSGIEVDERVHRFQEGRHRHIAEPYYDAVHVTHGHMDRMLDVIRDMPEIDVVHDFLEIVGPSMLAALGPGGPPVLHTLQWNLTGHGDYYEEFDGHGRVLFNGISEPQMRAAPERLLKQSPEVVHNGIDVDDFEYRPVKGDDVITLARFTPDDPDSPLHHYRDVQWYRQLERDFCPSTCPTSSAGSPAAGGPGSSSSSTASRTPRSGTACTSRSGAPTRSTGSSPGRGDSRPSGTPRASRDQTVG